LLDITVSGTLRSHSSIDFLTCT